MKKLISIVILISIIVLYFALQDSPGYFKVSGQSMLPTIQEENVGCAKIKSAVKRNDIVIFPHNNSDFIKRVVAIPGDRVKIDKNIFYLNGEIVKEPFLFKEGYTNLWEGGFTKNGKEINLPKNKYYVMGDNREHSSDSREFGLVDKKEFECIIPWDKQSIYLYRWDKNHRNTLSIKEPVTYILNPIEINQVLDASKKATETKIALESLKDKVPTSKYIVIEDSLNRQLSHTQVIIGRWLNNESINDSSTKMVWEGIIKMNNETRGWLKDL